MAPPERVLVFPAAALHALGAFQGFDPRVDHYLPRLLDPRILSYRPRDEVETDPTYKQLIPYVVLRAGPLVFHYTRGHGSGEARLRALRSIGVGGHICEEDGAASTDPYRQGLLREIDEEVTLDTPYTERCLGLINDDATPVGRVHLGVVHVFDLARPLARPRDPALTHAGFAPLEQLRHERDDFENWSRLVLDVL